jgi:creatinine amidohydrolase
MRTKPVVVGVLAMIAVTPVLAGAQVPVDEQLRAPRPIPAANSIWIEELTWMEIRDAMADGKTTVIVPTGGIEQNGPYVALGKHNYILQSTCEMLARQMGNALCAPIIKLVPEGNIEHPSGHMRYPGTISVREETFEAMLEDVGSSLKAHGFQHIIYIGDSGGNQRGMEVVAQRLNQRWGHPIALYIPEYYDNDAVIAYMNNDLGILEPDSEGVHDFYWITAMQMVTDPATVRYDERVAVGKASINGVSIVPKEQTVEVGRKLLQFRVDATIAAINAALAGQSP